MEVRQSSSNGSMTMSYYTRLINERSIALVRMHAAADENPSLLTKAIKHGRDTIAILEPADTLLANMASCIISVVREIRTGDDDKARETLEKMESMKKDTHAKRMERECKALEHTINLVGLIINDKTSDERPSRVQELIGVESKFHGLARLNAQTIRGINDIVVALELSLEMQNAKILLRSQK